MSDQDQLGDVLGRVASGLYILTIAHEGNSTGMLASWVIQAGFEPPMITVAVKKGRYVEDWIKAGAAFNLNIVGNEHGALLGHFGKGFEPGEEAFEGLATSESPSGAPVLTGCLGTIFCEPRESLETGDHVIFSAEVTGASELNSTEPMVHIRKSGRHY